MAETTSREGGADAGWNLPTKHLPPPLGSRDLPDPLPLRKIVGASVIILATALGSGELILWPYIVTQVGIGILWLAIVGFTMQFFLNMEIERYTLATGETAVAGFTRFWKPWGIIFILGAILPNLFPGWVTSSATAITFTFGINQDLYRYIAIGLLVTIGLIVSLSPVVYQSIEKIEMVLVSIILIFLVFAIFIATDGSAWAGVITKAPQGILDFPQTMGVIGAASLLGAIAFAGAGAPTTWCRATTLGTKAWGWGLASPTSSHP
jgi:hypothetical protein